MNRPQKRRRFEDATTSFLSKATAALKKHDEADAFGILATSKLRKMSEEQRQFAETLMLETMNKGVRGELTRHTRMTEHIESRLTSQQFVQSNQHTSPGSQHHGGQWHHMQQERPHTPWPQDFNYTQL